MLTVGIDPGLSGGIGVLAEDATYGACYDLPVCREGKLSWIDGGALKSILLNHPGLKRVVIERVSAMPKQGVSSSFNFGVGFGSVLGVVQALQLPLQFVHPAQWKRQMALSKDKDAALHRARCLWPAADLSLKRHDGRAEALLIAAWALNYGRQ